MAGADLTFLYGESVPRCTHRIDKHFEGYNTLQYMSAGSVELAVGGQRHGLSGRGSGRRTRGRASRSTPPRRRERGGIATSRSAGRACSGGWRTAVSRRRRSRRRAISTSASASIDCSTWRPRRRGDAFATLRATHILEEMLIELAEDRSAARAGRRG